jgi:hypothetical protein
VVRQRHESSSRTRRAVLTCGLEIGRTFGFIANPPSDASFALLHAAGCSVGDVRLLTGEVPVWLVMGTNGENKIEARAAGQGEAWRHTVEQARSLRMLGRSVSP